MGRWHVRLSSNIPLSVPHKTNEAKLKTPCLRYRTTFVQYQLRTTSPVTETITSLHWCLADCPTRSLCSFTYYITWCGRPTSSALSPRRRNLKIKHSLTFQQGWIFPRVPSGATTILAVIRPCPRIPFPPHRPVPFSSAIGRDPRVSFIKMCWVPSFRIYICLWWWQMKIPRVLIPWLVLKRPKHHRITSSTRLLPTCSPALRIPLSRTCSCPLLIGLAGGKFCPHHQRLLLDPSRHAPNLVVVHGPPRRHLWTSPRDHV